MAYDSFSARYRAWCHSGGQSRVEEETQCISTPYEPRRNRTIVPEIKRSCAVTIDTIATSVFAFKANKRREDLLVQILTVYPIASTIARYLRRDEFAQLYNQQKIHQRVRDVLRDDYSPFTKLLQSYSRECTVCLVGGDEYFQRELNRDRWDDDGWRRGIHTCLSCADISCTACTIFFYKRDQKAYAHNWYPTRRMRAAAHFHRGEGFQAVHTYCKTCFVTETTRKVSPKVPRTLNLGLNAVMSLVVGMHVPGLVTAQPMHYTTLVEGDEVPPAPKSDSGSSTAPSILSLQPDDNVDESEEAEDEIVEDNSAEPEQGSISARFMPYFNGTMTRSSFVKYEGDMVPRELFENSASKCWMLSLEKQMKKKRVERNELLEVELTTP